MLDVLNILSIEYIQCKVHDCITVIQKGAKQAATDGHVVHFDYN